MGRPKKKSAKKLKTQIRVYLDKSTTETLESFTVMSGFEYVSNAARFIIVSFFKKQSGKKNKRDRIKGE